MTDRELLEQAANAAGIDAKRLPHAWPDRFDDDQWNPLTDDGDALSLAVKLQLCVQPYAGIDPDDRRFAGVYSQRTKEEFEELHNDDPYAATRRAIVRAAAEIGKDL